MQGEWDSSLLNPNASSATFLKNSQDVLCLRLRDREIRLPVSNDDVKIEPCRFRHAGDKGRWILLLLILDLGTRRCEWSASRPAAFYPRRKDPRYPVYRMGGPQSWSGHRGLRKNPLPLLGIESRSPGRPVCSQDTILTELPQLVSNDNG
jgi:hypothetical protein